MINARTTIRIFSCFFLLAVLFTTPSFAWEFTQSGATVVDMVGEVRVYKQGNADWRPAEVGMRVERGDQVETGDGAYAILKYDPANHDVKSVKENAPKSNLPALGKANTPQKGGRLALAKVFKVRKMCGLKCALNNGYQGEEMCVVGQNRTTEIVART